MRRRARGGTARTRPPSPTRSPETGSRCLPGRRASRSLHGAVSLARHSLKQYLYHLHVGGFRVNNGKGPKIPSKPGPVHACEEKRVGPTSDKARINCIPGLLLTFLEF